MTRSAGLFASVRTLLGTCLGIAQTRLELLATELEEERLRLAKMLWYGFLILFFLGGGILLLTLLVIVAFWDSHRLMALALAAAIYLGIALLCFVWLRRQAGHKPRLFAASLAELGKDRIELASNE